MIVNVIAMSPIFTTTYTYEEGTQLALLERLKFIKFLPC